MADNSEEEQISLKFNTNAGQVAGDINNLNASIDDTTTSTEEAAKATEKQNAGYKTLKVQIKEANVELQKAIQLHGETSTQAINAAKGVAELKDQMQAASDLTKGFNPDQKMKALGAATQIAGTGLQGVTAGMALFGDQSKDTQEKLLKVQAAMAFSDAVSNLSNLGDQFKVFKSIVTDTFAKIVAARQAELVVTEETTAAQKILNLVAKQNPYILLASAIAAVGVATYAWIEYSKKSEAQLQKTTNAVNANKLATDKLEASIEENKSTTESANAIEVARAKALGASDAQIQKIIASQKQLASSTALQNARDAYKNLTDSQENLSKALRSGNEDIIKSATDARDAAKDSYTKANDDVNKAINDQTLTALNAQIASNQKHQDIQDKADQKTQTQKEKDKAKRIADREKDLKDMAAKDDEVQTALIEQKVKADKRDQDAKVKDKEDFLKRLTDAEEAAAKLTIATDTAVLNHKKSVQDSTLNIITQGAQLIQSLAPKSKALQSGAIIAENAVGVAKIIINTQAANAAVNLKYALLPGGEALAATETILNDVSAGLGIASSVAATAKALSAIGSGGSPSAPTMSRSSQPSVGFVASQANQIGQTVTGGINAQQPLKVFVAESDITFAQNSVRALVEKNHI